MVTDPSPVLSPEDLRKNFEKLQSDLSVVQNELDQALGVWRAILVSEKKEFKQRVEEREKSWDRDEQLWQKDRQAYEQKIQDLETFFKQQVEATEKNAVRALNELDGAWQVERQRWQNILTQQVKEAKRQSELQTASQQQWEQRLSQLTEQNAQLQASVAEIPSLQAEIANWQADKAAWQQSFSERTSELNQREHAWAAQFQEKENQLLALQQENLSLRKNLNTLETRLKESEAAKQSQENNMGTYVQTLENQIAGLQEFVEQMLVAAHPMRRKTDPPQSGPRTTPFLWPPPPRVSR